MYNRFQKGMSNGGAIGNGNEPLTDDQLRAAVPSIFAQKPHDSRTDRFVAIPTNQVVDHLRENGFFPFFAQQARTRVLGKQNYTRHMIRLRHASLLNAAGESFEIILTNANDGTSTYNMIPGFFRFVCANGLFTGDTFSPVKIRHTGKALDQVIEGAYSVLEQAPLVCDQVDRFKGLNLSEGARRAFAHAVHMLRFPKAYDEFGTLIESDRLAPVDAVDLLTTRRYADKATDLWTTLNVLQENTVRGGLHGWTTATDKETGLRTTRNQKVRAVNGIGQATNLNRAIWTLGEKMAELVA